MNKRIRLLRDTLGLSRNDFGAAIGVSGDVINNLERGRNKTPTSHIFINHLCSVYNVNKEWLLTGIGEMFINTASITNEETAFKKLSCSALQILKDFHELSPKEQSDFIQQAEKIISNLD